MIASDWTAPLLNHLWQSTAVAILAWLLTLALRHNSARVRYAIWLAASIKFLLPFQLLTSAGARLSRPVGTGGAQLYFIVEEFTRPVRQAPIAASQPATSASPAHSWSLFWTCMAAAWLCGFMAQLVRWISAWRSASRIAAAAAPISSGREFAALARARSHARMLTPIRLLLSSAGMEPGVFGIVRPVLFWPAGLSQHLSDAQMDTIMAHETEHARRHDNLTAALHALVEALFWFHPLVRWMSTQLCEERERACDECVIRQNAQPEAYAQSILTVCSFCMEPASICVSGVSGAGLKQRILRIMTRRSGAALTLGRKCLLGAAALLLIAAPLGFGVLHGQSTAGSSKAGASSAGLPKYDVASIKPSSPNARGFMLMMMPDGIDLKDTPPQTLLQMAFDVQPDRIVGAPDWVRSRHFDVNAKVSPEDVPKLAKLTMDQRRAMLLPLLAERFGLKYHHEKRELPIYSLVVAKGGPRLTASKVGNRGPGRATPPSRGDAPPAADEPPGEGGSVGEGMRIRTGSIQSRGGSIAFLANALSGMVGRSVVDKTGLTGDYDFSLRWTPDEGMRALPGSEEGGGPSADPGGPTLFSAIEEQLGLKLQPEKGLVDVIVIDRIDLPTKN